MSYAVFASRLTRSPLPFDAAAGADARARFADLPPELVQLIEGTAGCAPYLKALMEKEESWLRPALADAPEAALAAEFARLRALPPDQLAQGLRQGKRRVAVLTALADLAGVWPLETVTAALSDLADLATDLALKAFTADEIRRGKLPGATPEDAATAGGMFALAMGKGGARELNYSSDIDLICLFDQMPA